MAVPAFTASSAPAQAGAASRLAEEAMLEQVGAGGFIQFHPALADRLGFKAALFLGHALYWSRHLAKKHPHRAGWFYMTARQWQNATALTPREQTGVRELLVANGLLSERVAGLPARLHYRVDLARLAQWAGLHGDADGHNSITWDAFAPWLKGSVSFYRPLARASGSVAGGLYLSYLLRQQYTAARSGDATLDGYFRLSPHDARVALCLGHKTQRNVRDRLGALGFVHERGGLLRIDLQALQNALGWPSGERVRVALPSLRLAAPVASELVHSVRWLAQAGTRDPAEPVPDSDRTSEQQQLEVFDRWLIHSPQGQRATQMMLDLFAGPEPVDSEPLAHSDAGCQSFALLSNLPCPFVEPALPFCRIYIQQENNPTTTTARAGARETTDRIDKKASRRRRNFEISASAAQSSDGKLRNAQRSSGSGDLSALIMPKALAAEWHEAVRATLAAAPVEQRQALLDELEGQLGIQGKTIHNPPGYLHVLIKRQANGSLDLAMAEKVAADRREREQVQAAIDRASVNAAAARAIGPATDAVAEPSAAAIEARQKLQALRQQFVGKGERV